MFMVFIFKTFDFLTEKPQSFLPEQVEWKHCLGTEVKYRGYPCSLWSLFHVLTVSQVELENAKANPCKASMKTNIKNV